MRLIDADALGIGLCNPDVFMDRAYAAGWNGVVRLLQSAPTVTPESPQWISVKDKLPEPIDRYITYSITGSKDLCWIIKQGDEYIGWLNAQGVTYPMSYITHWMPQPQPHELDEWEATWPPDKPPGEVKE